ncbi:fibronectin type III domain-containing protein 7-like [Girardinichthys multiradiatus]|uniref:fibronectin type III domain-containing protein 7-like n=1 Tax=Girardinichthys multiradiatus TaxID=208333 RepID=UPI001FAD01A9|nr:fibronectin type III domain-containing protein 7-like [Girardinichthys multiradiatus]
MQYSLSDISFSIYVERDMEQLQRIKLLCSRFEGRKLNRHRTGDADSVQYAEAVVQPPTTVTLTATGKSTAQVTWNPVSKVLRYQVTVRDIGRPNKPPVVRNSQSTSMDIGYLEPCSFYTVGVSSVNIFMVPGEPSIVAYNTTTIGDVTTVSVDYSCSTSSVTVTWDAVIGAGLYRAVAVDRTGASLNCTSVSTSCQIPELRCGENYQVRVAAISDDCESIPSVTSTFETVPCAPVDLEATHDCSSNAVVFRWQPTNNTHYYVATAVDDTGKATECMTLDGICYFTDVSCGRFYTYSVYAVSPECNSQISQPKFVRTSPCLPTYVRTKADCITNTLITTWDSSEGALSYTISAEGNNGETYNCSSPNNTCKIIGVPCGEQLSVWFLASNDICSTDKMLVEAAQTAPCPPTDIEAFRDCDANHAVIAWQNKQTSGVYTATLKDLSGPQLNCTSNTFNNCTIANLPCGKKYNVTVTNGDGQCQSTSASISMDSENYTTIISRAMGPPLYCNSTDTQCTVGGLWCERSYTVTVFSITGTCLSLPSKEVVVKTLPCPPTNVTAVHMCASDPVPVSWTHSGNAKLFIAVASGSGGHRAECTTNETSCSLLGLQCGEVYTVSVVGADNNCTGLQSKPLSLKTEPCSPSNVTSQVICGAGAAQVFWTPSMNAVSYEVKATSTSQTLTCNSSFSNCTLRPLVCGQAYDVQVSATDGTCASNYSTPFRQDQVPCTPESVTTDLQCGTNDLTVSWASSPLPLNYSVKAVTLDGSGPITCNTNNASCVLRGFQCGQTLNISVKASSVSCSGPYSPMQTVRTEANNSD